MKTVKECQQKVVTVQRFKKIVLNYGAFDERKLKANYGK